LTWDSLTSVGFHSTGHYRHTESSFGLLIFELSRYASRSFVW